MALEEAKTMLRAVLMSCKEGVPAHILQRDYRDITQEPLPFKKLGFSNLDDFINSIPDVVRVRRNKQGEVVYHAVANEETAHIQSLVSKQKSTKKKKKLQPAQRRPVRRSEPYKFFTPGSNSRPIPKGRPPPWGQKISPVRSPPWKLRPPLLGKSPLNIQVNMGNGSRRHVTVNRVFNEAVSAATADKHRSEVGNFGQRFEVPPRFQRRHEEKENVPTENTDPTKPKSVPRPLQAQRTRKINFEKVPDGEKYLNILKDYALANDITLNFDAIPTKVDNNPGFVSSVTINGKTFGSGDVFGTIIESEYAAASYAVKSLGLKPSTEHPRGLSPPASDDSQVKRRVKELIKGKTNGLWGTRLEVMYKENYNEEPPSNLMYLIQRWTDVVRVEEYPQIERTLLYPVSEEEREKNLQASVPRAITSTTAGGDAPQPNVKTEATPTSSPDRPRSQSVVNQKIKEIKIPAGENLPVGEKVTVYMTFLGEDGSVCVQHENSAIFQITQQIDVVERGPVPDIEDLQPGRFIAALYITETEKLWSRAEVISREGTTVDVLFIDYGNSASCPQNSTRFLTEELAQYPMQIIYCYLHGVAPLEDGDTWSKEFKERFAELVTDEALIAITRDISPDGTHIVDLFLSSDPSTSINDRLVTEGILRKLTDEEQSVVTNDDEPEELELPTDTSQWDIYVSFINSSTNSVMIRLVGEKYSDKLEELERKLEEAFHSADEDVEIGEGQVCVAYVEELFHRVRVIKKETKKYQCYFLDHGDSDGLIPDQLRVLDPKINKLLPYQAFEVSLDGLEGFAENVTTLEKLFDMALGKTLVAEITARDEIFSIVMYDTQGDSDINVNQEILKAVQLEAETSLLTSSGSNPQSTESSPLPLRKTTDTLSKALTSPSPQSLSPKRQPQQPQSAVAVATSATSEVPTVPKSQVPSKSTEGKENNGTDSGETESGEGSWETEEEEVIEATGKTSTASGPKSIQGAKGKKTDSHPVKVTKQPQTKEVTTPVKKLTESLSSLSTQDTVMSGNPPGATKGAQTLYSWGSSGGPTEASKGNPCENDEIALVNVQVYNTRPVPKKFEIPPKGEYCDVHIINIFDPTNFVCIPFQFMNELDELIRKMMEYFNSVEEKLSLAGSDLMVGQMYAGRKEGAWYRVIVKNVIQSNHAAVYMVDFGEFIVMGIEDIRLLPYCFAQLPQLGFKGKLFGIKPAKESKVWSEAAKYKFIQMAHNKSLVALTCGTEEVMGQEVTSMRLVDTSQQDQDICLDDELLEMGVAEKIRS